MRKSKYKTYFSPVWLVATLFLVSGCDYISSTDTCTVREQSIPVYFSGIAGSKGIMELSKGDMGNNHMIMRVRLFDPRLPSQQSLDRKPLVELTASGQCHGNIIHAQIAGGNDINSPLKVLGGEIVSLIDSSSNKTMFGHWNATLLSVESLFRETDLATKTMGKNFSGFWVATAPPL